MKSLNLVNTNNKKRKLKNKIYNKLQEAELEMVNTSKRYSKKEILDSLNQILKEKN